MDAQRPTTHTHAQTLTRMHTSSVFKAAPSPVCRKRKGIGARTILRHTHTPAPGQRVRSQPPPPPPDTASTPTPPPLPPRPSSRRLVRRPPLPSHVSCSQRPNNKTLKSRFPFLFVPRPPLPAPPFLVSIWFFCFVFSVSEVSEFVYFAAFPDSLISCFADFVFFFFFSFRVLSRRFFFRFFFFFLALVRRTTKSEFPPSLSRLSRLSPFLTLCSCVPFFVLLFFFFLYFSSFAGSSP